MKNFISCTILLVCIFMSIPGIAADAKEDEVSVYLLKNWLSEKYGCKIDSDDTLIINANGGKILIDVIKKAKLIRIYSLYSRYDKRTRSEMIILANKFNNSKRFLRVSISSDSGSVCDYYLPYDGGLNSKNLLSTVLWFRNLEDSWADFVIKGGEE